MKKSVKLAIIDHISSASAILYPIKKIAEVTTTCYLAPGHSVYDIQHIDTQHNANSA
jgi:hypothetical protein